MPKFGRRTWLIGGLAIVGLVVLWWVVDFGGPPEPDPTPAMEALDFVIDADAEVSLRRDVALEARVKAAEEAADPHKEIADLFR